MSSRLRKSQPTAAVNGPVGSPVCCVPAPPPNKQWNSPDLWNIATKRTPFQRKVEQRKEFMIVFIQISSHLLTKIFCWLFLHIFLPRTKPPDSVALNGQPSSYSIYFEELCKYSDAKVQFTGTDISMNWVSSQISAQFSSSSSYPCSFRPSRAGGAGLLSTYLSIYLQGVYINCHE